MCNIEAWIVKQNGTINNSRYFPTSGLFELYKSTKIFLLKNSNIEKIQMKLTKPMIMMMTHPFYRVYIYLMTKYFCNPRNDKTKQAFRLKKLLIFLLLFKKFSNNLNSQFFEPNILFKKKF